MRSLLRQPWVLALGMVFPLFIAATNSSTMSSAVDLPGFPEVDSMLQFLLPASITQSVLFSGLSAGTDTAIDLRFGFFDRLLVAPWPAPRSSSGASAAWRSGAACRRWGSW